MELDLSTNKFAEEQKTKSYTREIMIMLKKAGDLYKTFTQKQQKISGLKVRLNLLARLGIGFNYFREAWGEKENTELAHVNLPSIVGI